MSSCYTVVVVGVVVTAVVVVVDATRFVVDLVIVRVGLFVAVRC